MAPKRRHSRAATTEPPAWGRGLHAFAERFGIAVLSGLHAARRRARVLAHAGMLHLPRVRRGARSGARLALRSARGQHGSLAMLGVWLITGVALLALLLYALAARTPSWFRTIDPSDPALIDLAQRVENRVITQLYKFRGEVNPSTNTTGEPWTLTITEDEATAWLSCKLPDWVRNLDDSARWPREVSSVQASFGPSRLWVAAAVDDRTILSFGVAPRLEDTGVRLVSARAGIGSLTLPASWLGGTAHSLLDRAADPETAARVWAITTGARPIAPEPIIELEDGRHVRILAIEPTRASLTLRCQTEVPRTR